MGQSLEGHGLNTLKAMYDFRTKQLQELWKKSGGNAENAEKMQDVVLGMQTVSGLVNQCTLDEAPAGLQAPIQSAFADLENGRDVKKVLQQLQTEVNKYKTSKMAKL